VLDDVVVLVLVDVVDSVDVVLYDDDVVDDELVVLVLDDVVDELVVVVVDVVVVIVVDVDVYSIAAMPYVTMLVYNRSGVSITKSPQPVMLSLSPLAGVYSAGRSSRHIFTAGMCTTT